MPKMRLLNPERLNIGNQIPLKLFREGMAEIIT
jgi:hypothetical protein